MADIKLDKETFHRRLKRLYQAWLNSEGENGFSKMDSLVVAVGVNNNIVYSKSGALQTWLFGYELTDAISVFTENAVYFLASKKKIDFLRQAESKDQENGVAIKLLVRAKKEDERKDEGRLSFVLHGHLSTNCHVALFTATKLDLYFSKSMTAFIRSSSSRAVQESYCNYPPICHIQCDVFICGNSGWLCAKLTLYGRFCLHHYLKLHSHNTRLGKSRAV